MRGCPAKSAEEEIKFTKKMGVGNEVSSRGSGITRCNGSLFSTDANQFFSADFPSQNDYNAGVLLTLFFLP